MCCNRCYLHYTGVSRFPNLMIICICTLGLFYYCGITIYHCTIFNTQYQTSVKRSMPTGHLQTILLPRIPGSTSEKSLKSSKTKSLVPNQSSNFSVCCKCMGRIGNHLFQFASAYGLAALNNMSLVIDNNCRIPTVFKISSQYRVDVKGCSSFAVKHEKQGCSYDANLAKFTPNTSYRLETYLQSWTYFESSLDSLKKELVIADVYKNEGHNHINIVLNKYNISDTKYTTLIGVHIRRGDYVNNKIGRMVATADYLYKAVTFFNSKFKNIIYIVCSDGIEWSIQHMPKGLSCEFMIDNSPEVDLAILSSCNHVITTVGTFGWWAGWLSEGIVTYFKWPAKEGSVVRKEYSKDYTDFFLPYWYGL